MNPLLNIFTGWWIRLEIFLVSFIYDIKMAGGPYAGKILVFDIATSQATSSARIGHLLF